MYYVGRFSQRKQVRDKFISLQREFHTYYVLLWNQHPLLIGSHKMSHQCQPAHAKIRCVDPSMIDLICSRHQQDLIFRYGIQRQR